ncbi:MAG TPA: (d)CMP kinase [Pirellulaceae bacterium]|nr:(d)CMP kinase [Pirellulaceae bacterium]
MIVTIDGPAGAGKSCVSRQLARRLGFRFLDTGAMYRAVTVAAIQRAHDWSRPELLEQIADDVRIEFRDEQVLVDGRDVSREIRTPEVTGLIHYAANHPGVRRRMVELQRQVADGLDYVTEGRDQGTVVFPSAELKIFLTATPEERARRRVAELLARGEQASFDEVLAAQNLRDERDARREVGPLRPAVDAVHVLTDGLTLEQVEQRLVDLVAARRAMLQQSVERSPP